MEVKKECNLIEEHDWWAVECLLKAFQLIFTDSWRVHIVHTHTSRQTHTHAHTSQGIPAKTKWFLQALAPCALTTYFFRRIYIAAWMLSMTMMMMVLSPALTSNDVQCRRRCCCYDAHGYWWIRCANDPVFPHVITNVIQTTWHTTLLNLPPPYSSISIT